MNFDQLQEQWQSEEVSVPEISLENQGKINNPLQRIRKNMKMEFWMTVFTIIPLLIWSVFSIENPKAKLYASMLIGSMALVTIFYFNIFYKSYKSLSNNTLNSLDSLKDLLFQLKLNEQYYISYYLAFVPFLVCEMIIIYEFMPTFKKIDTFGLVFTFVMALVFGFVILYFWGRFWFNEFYGKHINDISVLINEISGIKNNQTFGSTLFKTNTKHTYLSKTELFFVKKLGNMGTWVNISLWIIFLILLLLVVSFCVGFIVGYLGVYLKNM